MIKNENIRTPKLNDGNTLTRVMILYLEFSEIPDLGDSTRLLFHDIGLMDLQRQLMKIPSIFS